jgi:HD-GYP domain-containing protein (c-di-GMP phosphodiesterase class II)
VSAVTRSADSRGLEGARDFVVRLTALLRACGLYTSDNAALRAAAESLRSATLVALDGGAELELAVRGESLYVAGTRLRESLVASTAYQRVVEHLQRASVRALRIDESVTAPELETFARLLAETAHGKRRPENLAPELALRGSAIAVEVGAPELESSRDLDAEVVAKRIYLRSISVVKHVFHSLREGDQLAARRVKRVVQEMIESLDADPGYLLNLASLKNYDEYTFNHSVNTGVLAVALGRHVGLERRQLYALGQAGMLHDLGKLCLPIELLNKRGRLSREERGVVELHPVDGFLSIAAQMGVSGDTLDVALAAYEHHITESGGGYPPRPAPPGKRLLSRIVSIVDCYDAMTSARVYRDEPIAPPQTLAYMYGASGQSEFDPLLLRCFMNLMGVFPIGTPVMLSDGCVGLVVGGSPDNALRHFPIVRVMVDADGQRRTPVVVDLAATAKDADPLRVAQVVSAARFGISALEALL